MGSKEASFTMFIMPGTECWGIYRIRSSVITFSLNLSHSRSYSTIYLLC